MTQKKEAVAGNDGWKTDLTGGQNKSFSTANYNAMPTAVQCPDCELRDRRIVQFERLTATLAEHIDAMHSREVRR